MTRHQAFALAAVWIALVAILAVAAITDAHTSCADVHSAACTVRYAR